VLFGEIAYVPIDVWVTAGGVNLGPRAVWILGGLLILILLMLLLGYKGLLITTFNAEYAAALGISVSFWHYLLMSAVSVTTVVSFEAVGAILVVAFLIVPPATAYLLTQRIRPLLILTALLGFGASLGGYYLAVAINGSIAGAMSVVAGLFFLAALVWKTGETVRPPPIPRGENLKRETLRAVFIYHPIPRGGCGCVENAVYVPPP
jgi:manganese/zinc/iron transport system permease protein